MDPIPGITADEIAAAQLPLERASTLPRRAYLSPEVYEQEETLLFRRHWLCVGRADQIPKPGDYFTIELMRCRTSAATDP